MARNLASKKVIIADSIDELSKIIFIDPDKIKEFARTRGSKSYKGFQFRSGINKEIWPDLKE